MFSGRGETGRLKDFPGALIYETNKIPGRLFNALFIQFMAQNPKKLAALSVRNAKGMKVSKAHRFFIVIQAIL